MGAGHFDKVIDEIDKMIQVLKDEEKDDMVQRDWCKEEYHQNAQEKAETKWLIKRNEAQITKLQASIDLLIENIEDTEKEIELTKEQMKKMTEERTDENDAFKSAKADDEAAIKLLGMAVEALSGYYKKNDIKMLQEPEFAVDKFQAPDATFADKGARKNESKGIVSILTMLKEDLEDEIKNGIKDEAANQVEYEKQMAAAKKLLESLEERKVNLESDKAKTEEKKEAEEGKLAENQENLAINEEYKKSITPDCDWMLNSFQERRDKRAAEMNGLVKAKEFLSGASLVQASAKPHVQEFEQIGFLHQQ
jgi:DNA repair exonuclease SbcCD ATPase subunit